ncbi:Protein of unknown function (DUF3128) [Geosmithia morbida]|uniref:Early meiotic induction protein 1 n=1 Tax=Geosmithia morbida TaxID=1094350 RepID=A0A9P5D182_9HYPO|nr:Protein of unknown function (DUF3128) [Geosmithia morbida]KAF4123603.1 Protein of unknown function (DUF3128) [Geosmithia morbida]
MGWLWASSPSPPKPAPPAQEDAAATTTNNKPSSSSTAAPNNVDPEVQKFLDFLDNSSAPQSSKKPSPPTTKEDGSLSWISSMLKSSTPEDPSIVHVPPRDAVSESLLPTDMSCRQAFDLAWGCNSVGGQWNAVYRYGEMRSCSDQWDDFWFCMRTKSFTGPAKAEAIKEHYRDREHSRYYAPGRRSSEDVWKPREEKVAPGTAFSHKIELPSSSTGGVNDDEWRKQENERRRQVREKLGVEEPTPSPSSS